ncbi:MAG TPA: Asp-tRNA(Asn)/Glu-tRNA(Gln) amidotransferase subunit GatC [Thermomicrobiales bacterium]|mgnify:CR=1 FL=1|nr:Asp-tRNA(Asn)/Glu-tRNA(Gln) amidotransferase subunit GatC [Thermomicrobiales bacterium]
MRLSLEQVQAVATLARLGLQPDELERMRDQLSSILTSIEAIDALDTSAIPPTAQTIALTNVLREDIAAPSLPRDTVMANAPRQRDGFFEVHTVFGTEVPEA